MVTGDLRHGEVTSLRMLHWQLCDAGQVDVYEGPAAPDGTATYWVDLCPAHADQGLDGSPVAGPHHTERRGRCGSVVEFRDFDTLLRSHADLWLRPLLGVHVDDFDGDWAATLTRACEQLQQHGADTEGSPYYSALTMAEMARASAAEGDKRMTCTALSHAETLTWAAHRQAERRPAVSLMESTVPVHGGPLDGEEQLIDPADPDPSVALAAACSYPGGRSWYESSPDGAWRWTGDTP